jgi:acetyl-CoA acetyltransferase
MAYGSWVKMPAATRALSRTAAIVGLGESDYNVDYQAARAKAPGYEGHTSESLASLAFERALSDSGLRREDVDGISVSFLYGGPKPEDMAQLLGLTPRHFHQGGGIMAGNIPTAVQAIAEGKCDTIALVYAAATRSIGRKFGGQVYGGGGGAPSSYYYHNPWGWSSQAAHWALIWRRYQSVYGATEADLGAVAVQLRENAIRTPHAIMRDPLTIEEYLGSRYIVRPLHLLDICLVNDGGVCLIITRADKARDTAHRPVLIGGWGEAYVRQDKLDTLVRQRMKPQFETAGAQALDMAQLSLSDVQHFECYDASSMHLINHLEGHGFAEPGEGVDFCKRGDMALGGKLPVNTAGGMLSGSYMHGWNHVAEITRQLRHEAQGRQVDDVNVSMFSLAQTDQVHPIIFMRGDKV